MYSLHLPPRQRSKREKSPGVADLERAGSLIHFMWCWERRDEGSEAPGTGNHGFRWGIPILGTKCGLKAGA